MARIEANIPDDLEVRIQRLVEEGEFVSLEEAIQELLSSGLTAYRTDFSDDGDGIGSDFDEFGEPEEPIDHDDDYVF